MVDLGAHETHPNGLSIAEVDCGGHDASPYIMNESLSSEVDWGGHDVILNRMNEFLFCKVD